MSKKEITEELERVRDAMAQLVRDTFFSGDDNMPDPYGAMAAKREYQVLQHELLRLEGLLGEEAA